MFNCTNIYRKNVSRFEQFFCEKCSLALIFTCTNIYRKKNISPFEQICCWKCNFVLSFNYTNNYRKKLVRLNKYFKYSRSIALMIICTNNSCSMKIKYSWRKNKILVQLNTVKLDLCSFALMFNRNTNLLWL